MNNTKMSNTVKEMSNVENTKSEENTMNNKQVEVSQKQLEQAEEAREDITTMYDKMMDKARESLEKAGDNVEIRAEYEELLAELEADKQELLEGTIVGSPQYLKDEFTMHVASMSIGAVMTIVGGVLLVKTRKVIGITKKKIAGWILAGLGIGIVGLHIAQMFFS